MTSAKRYRLVVGEESGTNRAWPINNGTSSGATEAPGPEDRNSCAEDASSRILKFASPMA